MANQADKNPNPNANPNNPARRKNPQPQPQPRDGRQQQAEQGRETQPGGARPDPNADRKNPG